MIRSIARVSVFVGAGCCWTACIPAPVLRPRDAQAEAEVSAADVVELDAIDAASGTDGAPAERAIEVDAVETDATDAALPTDHTDVTATDHVDVTATDHVDVTATDHVDVTATDHVDVVVMDAGSCEAGRTLRGGICVEIGAARPMWPMTAQTVTQRRPRLRWALGPEADGARVEVCRDRGCAMRVVSYTATGSEGAPAEDLPPGPLFWRVWARAGSAEALRPSAVWSVYVPWRSGAVHTAQRDTFDVNGDGYADFVVGVPERRELRVYLGSATGPRPAVVLTDPFIDPASMALARAGDVNGDGRSDLLVRYNSTRWRVLYATSGGFDVNARTDINLSPSDASATLESVESVGDPNGDGFTDLAVTSTTFPALLTRVGLHFGSSAGVSAFASETREMLAATGLRAMGDLNGDGYEDFVTVSGDFGPPASVGIRVYLGQHGRLAWTTFGSTVETTQVVVRAVGRSDVNGDGRPDALGFGLFATDRVPIVLGGRSGLETSPLFVGPGDGSTTSAVCDGDLNGDGLADHVIEARNAQTVKVFLGSPSGPSPTPAANVPTSSSQHGISVVCPGDIDGDGVGDAVVRESTANGTSWRVLRGHTTAGQILLGPTFDTGPTNATNLLY